MMWDKMVARMVERAMPPNIIDPVQGIIAAEAAEYGIRQTARVASIAGVILFGVIAALLYNFVPSQKTSQGPSEVPKPVTQPGADNTKKLRQANEDLQKKLDDVTRKRDALQGKVTNLEGQVADLSRQLQSARRSAANVKKQAEAPRKKTLQPTKQASEPTKTRVGTKPRSTSVGIGNDARTVGDPAERIRAAKERVPPAAVSAAPEPASPAVPSTPTVPSPPTPPVAVSTPTEPTLPVTASAPPATLEPPPVQAQPTVAPTAVSARQRGQAAPPAIAPDPLTDR